ncbi:MAG TPA: cytochrome-c oxidase, cbb3-type subunit II [Pseudomonadales bacterium]|nr:cytochrome-c oxidase, cbb3-type subunit II [Pseudomonadales bacterium]HNN86243.1 cytochrome-c oxidase, cbb3-type subunit II [Pseudomonadales bacterium]
MSGQENLHSKIEKNIALMMVLIVVVISFSVLVEIIPLAFQKDVVEPIKGLKPLNALQLEGRDIYIREGCNTCHSQMIRPFRAETERYGFYSVAGESVYEHPFLWGSKRTGPDLARVGGRYSDEWHSAHLYNPRDVVPESVMPAYTWLFDNTLDGKDTAAKMRALRELGVPYTDEDIAGAQAAVVGKLEVDAVIAYLQQLGTLIPANPAIKQRSEAQVQR